MFAQTGGRRRDYTPSPAWACTRQRRRSDWSRTSTSAAGPATRTRRSRGWSSDAGLDALVGGRRRRRRHRQADPDAGADGRPRGRRRAERRHAVGAGRARCRAPRRSNGTADHLPLDDGSAAGGHGGPGIPLVRPRRGARGVPAGGRPGRPVLAIVYNRRDLDQPLQRRARGDRQPPPRRPRCRASAPARWREVIDATTPVHAGRGGVVPATRSR